MLILHVINAKEYEKIKKNRSKINYVFYSIDLITEIWEISHETENL